METVLKADALTFSGPLVARADDLIRQAVETRTTRRKKLAVILETEGGYIEVAERIADIFRRHYRVVEFVVPNYAMSAGTVLAMSGDAIHMDYYSTLGPIDPQVPRPGGRRVPALGYLIQYERLIDKSASGDLTTAELTFLVQKFDPAELYQFEQERELSIELLKQWLVKYKFKNWKRTKTRRKSVTRKMKVQRAEEIARMLNKTDEWHSHNRGISMVVLRDKLRLQIEDFGQNEDLNKAIGEYYRLLTDYLMRIKADGAIHRCNHFVPFGGE